MKEKELLIRNNNEVSLNTWREKEKSALDLIQIVGELRFDRAIELVIFRRDIYDFRPSEVLNHHLVAKNYIDQEIPIELTLEIAQQIAAIENLAPSKIDIGTLASEWLLESANHQDINAFIGHKLDGFSGNEKNGIESKDIILYGFGRIGRLLARRIIELTGRGDQLRLKAIVIRPKLKDQKEEAQKRAALLKTDTVHGDFQGIVEVAEDGSELIINGNRVQLIYAKQPTDINYTEYGIQNALLIDNTGVWRNREELSVHLRPGVENVMLTAPAADIPNIVYGVNHEDFDFKKESILCAASCTTNAIVPIISVLEKRYGIEKGHIETVHSYTNDQNLLDNFHKKPRRGRAAAENLVLTSTGAAKAVAKVIPHLAGKLTGNAVRIPTPNVSLAIMNLSLKLGTSVKELNAILQEAAMSGALVEQIHYSNSTEYVSSQAIGMTATSVLDAPSTLVSHDGMNAVIYAWYDNEYGYSCQVIRLAKHVAKVRRQVYF